MKNPTVMPTHSQRQPALLSESETRCVAGGTQRSARHRSALPLPRRSSVPTSMDNRWGAGLPGAGYEDGRFTRPAV